MNVVGFHDPQACLVRYLVRKNVVPELKIGCTLMRFLLGSTIKSSRQPSIVPDDLLSTSPKMEITFSPMILSISTTSVTVANNRVVSHSPWSGGHSNVLSDERPAHPALHAKFTHIRGCPLDSE